MAPPVAVSPVVQELPTLSLKKNFAQNDGTQIEVKEDYDGDYRFAPIEEGQVSRAMIKRFRVNPLYAWTCFLIFSIGTST